MLSSARMPTFHKTLPPGREILLNPGNYYITILLLKGGNIGIIKYKTMDDKTNVKDDQVIFKINFLFQSLVNASLNLPIKI